jgi:hypothetical protein
MSGEKRESARFITEMSAVLRAVKGGATIDDRATAHDVSLKGFKVETQAQLAEKGEIAFTLLLPEGARVEGTGRVVWTSKESWATWAGIEFVKLSWSDKRKLSVLLEPGSVDWSRIGSSASKLVFCVVVVSAAHRLLYSPSARGVLVELTPKIVALVLMGWACLNLVRKDRRY